MVVFYHMIAFITSNNPTSPNKNLSASPKPLTEDIPTLSIKKLKISLFTMSVMAVEGTFMWLLMRVAVVILSDGGMRLALSSETVSEDLTNSLRYCFSLCRKIQRKKMFLPRANSDLPPPSPNGIDLFQWHKLAETGNSRCPKNCQLLLPSTPTSKKGLTPLKSSENTNTEKITDYIQIVSESSIQTMILPFLSSFNFVFR